MYKRSFSRSPFSRGTTFGNKGFSRRPSRPAKGRGQRIDISKFVNKAIEQELDEIFKPKHSFSDFKIDERLKANITAKKYVSPTPIQDEAIPYLLDNKDIIGIANTGTGKTAAFLVPLINRVIKDNRENVLIMAPTRELAIQIDVELRGFARGLNIFSVCAVGGVNIGPQIRALRSRNNFIIGTPGRLKDLITRKFINLSTFNSVVLDEADRMLDMGFIDDMRFIMSRLPKARHTLFFSATFGREIEGLTHDFLNNPVKISVKTRDTSKNVEQDIIRIERGGDKVEVLHNLLIKPEFNKVLIFGRTKHGVERLCIALGRRGFKVDSIHGDKNHSQRQKALASFKNNYVQVLVATDVAARGLDISGISHVINYDLPMTYDDYVHRIGRTGRGEKKGKALTFIE